VNRLYNGGAKFGRGGHARITDRWAPYRSGASWYLWREIDGNDQTWV